MNNLTIVSACDRNFLWGAFLLAASCAKYLPATPVQILQTGFTDADQALITQFPTVKLLPLTDNDPRSVSNRKAVALLTADTEFVAWLDADCMVIGDITSLLPPPNGDFQIRLRGPKENAWIWRNHYGPGEAPGGLPKSVLKQWQTDIGQLAPPRLDTTCVANVFVLHRRHLDFIRHWQSQITRVIAPRDVGVVDNSNPAYFMMDESVLTSLLAFSNIAPPIGEYRLDREANRHVAHFGANPKPWTRWNMRLWYCHPHVMSLLDWARASGFRTPPLPASFEKRNRIPAYLRALADEGKVRVRSTGGNLLRKVGVKKKG
jgi:hypothetical protein